MRGLALGSCHNALLPGYGLVEHVHEALEILVRLGVQPCAELECELVPVVLAVALQQGQLALRLLQPLVGGRKCAGSAVDSLLRETLSRIKCGSSGPGALFSEW